MKLLTCTLSILLITLTTLSQSRFIVKGKIDNSVDSKKIYLARYRDGSMDPSDIDTIRDASFSLSDTISTPALYILYSAETSLGIWATPGQKTINITGKGPDLKAWQILDPSPLQQEANKYNIPEKAQIKLMAQRPVTAVWLHTMTNLSFGELLNPNGPYRSRLLQLYKRISKQQRESPIGQKITANLFPPPVVQIGDPMADMPVIDTQLVTHHLKDYAANNKYLLLDFGFIYCGACEQAIPETSRLHDSLQDKLTIIGINVDETALWRPKAIKKALPWIQVNDPKARSGGAILYGVKAYPHYVMISPEDKILGAWSGYAQGDLTKFLNQYLEGH